MQRYIDKFINYLKIEKNASKHTITNYTIDLGSFAAFFGLKKLFVEKNNELV